MTKLIASKPIHEIRSKVLTTTILQGCIGETVEAIIPEGAWI
jgi:hypothetical protein